MAPMRIVCALVVATSPALGAEPPAPPTETVVRFTVQPMAAPKPALKYQLLPELRDMQPGNPIQGYLKCFMEQNTFFHGKEAVANRDKWLTAPLESLPVKDLRDYGGAALRQADYAARLDTPDWQSLLPLKRDGIYFLMPDVQWMRRVALALNVRFRGAVADKRFDDGIKTAQTMFALSRHLGKHPTVIGSLVSNGVANWAVGPLEEMIQQPGCPNLYWALTDLPRPLLDLRTGLQGDRIFLYAERQMLDEREPMSERAIELVAAKLVDIAVAATLYGDDSTRQKWRAWLNAKVKDGAYLKAARKRLVEAGLDKNHLARFPPMQIVLLNEMREYEDRRDEMMKGMLLPYHQWEAVAENALSAMKGESLLWEVVGGSYLKVRRAQARLDQQIALLRHVEALRLHAAAHQGKLPNKLADIGVPLPVDPISDKPFIYKRDGDRVVLQGTPPRGEQKNAVFNFRFEVTMKP